MTLDELAADERATSCRGCVVFSMSGGGGGLPYGCEKIFKDLRISTNGMAPC